LGERPAEQIDLQRVTVYIDGFNLYYAPLKPNRAVRWLHLAALGSALRPADTVTVRYFTAKVLRAPDPSSEVRQRLHLTAIETLPTVTVEYGHFAAHEVRIALVSPPNNGPRTALVLEDGRCSAPCAELGRHGGSQRSSIALVKRAPVTRSLTDCLGGLSYIVCLTM
jgi:hypothetical protein